MTKKDVCRGVGTLCQIITTLVKGSICIEECINSNYIPLISTFSVVFTACSYQCYMKHACAVYVSYGSKVSSWDVANDSSENTLYCTPMHSATPQWQIITYWMNC